MKRIIPLGSNCRFDCGSLPFLIALFAIAAGSTAAAPAVLPNHDSYHPGEPIRVVFTQGPGNAKDWVGVYPEGIEPGSVGATLWNYVDGGQTGATGVSNGDVAFPGGLGSTGTWLAYLLENDGYTKLAQAQFTVLDPGAPLVHADRRSYPPGQSIVIAFTNAPANPRDWIGIYQAGQVPGQVESTLWNYVDGTRTGAIGIASGILTFSEGLLTQGSYVAYLLENDGYTILAQENFSVAALLQDPQVLSVEPANGSTNAPPAPTYTANIQIGSSPVPTNSVTVKLDGTVVTHQSTELDGRIQVRSDAAAILPANSEHMFELTFANAAGAHFTNTTVFRISNYPNLQLPTPLYLETFDGTPEGQLPAGWRAETFTEITNDELDLGNLDSASYATWTVVNVERFKGSFVPYSNPDASPSEKDDYHRVLTPGAQTVVNGKLVPAPASGRMLFGNSGYRRGASQVLFAFTPDFDLTGKTNVHLVFYSLWEQNQDSIGAIEYSIDRGQSWLPLLYYLDRNDLVLSEDGSIDAVATLAEEHGDVAVYTDAAGNLVGGTYGAFVAAPISSGLAAFIQPRTDDSPTDGKRVEVLRLSRADGQAQVRFRITHAGTDSWYFGIDNFGLYSLGADTTPPTVTIRRDGPQISVAWSTQALGYVLESRPSLSSGSWTTVDNVTGNSYVVAPAEGARFFRLRR